MHYLYLLSIKTNLFSFFVVDVLIAYKFRHCFWRWKDKMGIYHKKDKKKKEEKKEMKKVRINKTGLFINRSIYLGLLKKNLSFLVSNIIVFKITRLMVLHI